MCLLEIVALSISCVLSAAPLPGADLFIDGHHAERVGRYEAAEEAYLGCAELNGPLVHYAKVRAAVCQAHRGEPEAAVASLEKLLDEAPEGPWVPLVQKEIARLDVDLNRAREAATFFTKALQAQPDYWWLEPFRWQAAENSIALPELRTQGLAFFRNALDHGLADPDRAHQAGAFLVDSSAAEDRILGVIALVETKSYPEAAKALARMTPLLLGDPEVRARLKQLRAQLLIAKGYEKRGMKMLEEVVERYPGSDWIGKGLAFGAETLIRKGHLDRAEVLQRILARLKPDAPGVGEILWEIADRYAIDGMDDQALERFRMLAYQSRTNARSDDALLRVAHLHRKKDERADALAAYVDLLARFPDGDVVQEAAYWAGSLAASAGDEAGALDHFRTGARDGVGNYYAHRCQDLLNRMAGSSATAYRDLKVSGPDSFVSPLQLDLTPPVDPLSRFEDDERFVRLEFLGAHGLEEAEWEALYIHENLKGDEDRLPFYFAIGEAGLAYTAMQMAQRHALQRVRIQYPRAYWRYVADLGRTTKVDPFLVLSVVRQETFYRSTLTSPAGAKGIMQVMPATALWVAEVEQDVRTDHAQNLENPRNSLLVGTHYLKRMIREADGNLVYALASYNAGPGNCRKWRRKFGDKDLADFVESIPFRETRNYVKKVLGYYAAYHSVYPPATE